MKKGVAVFIFLVAFIKLNAQENHNYGAFPLFKNEVQSFIDTAKKASVWDGGHNVYLVDMYASGPGKGSLCFSISYIMFMSEHCLGNAIGKYMFITNNEIVLINTPDSLVQNWICLNYVTQIDSSNKISIKNKLIHDNIYISDYGPGAALGLLSWFDGQSTKRKFFEHVDDLGWLIKQYTVPEILNEKVTTAVKTYPVPSLR